MYWERVATPPTAASWFGNRLDGWCGGTGWAGAASQRQLHRIPGASRDTLEFPLFCLGPRKSDSSNRDNYAGCDNVFCV